MSYKLSDIQKALPLRRGSTSSVAKRGGGVLTFIFFIFSFSFFISCKEDDEPTPPVINLLSMSKDTLVQFQDSLDIVIKYTDTDGDVGETDPDNNSLYIKDSRLPDADYYHVLPLSPPNTALNIQGELTVKIKNMFLLGNGGNETAYFTIKLKDQRGNWSNQIITPNILIVQ